MNDDEDNNGNTALASAVVTAPPAVAEEARYCVTTLPSGRLAQVLKRGTGRHLVLAERMAPKGSTLGSAPWQLALIAVKCRVGGQDLTYEDVLDLADTDILHLMAHSLGNGTSDANTLLSSASTGASAGQN